MSKNKRVTQIAIGSISFYQKYLSFDTGNIPASLGLQRKTCRFYPTCSEYTKEAILRYGVFRGTILGCKRIARCHPWSKEHFDPVP